MGSSDRVLRRGGSSVAAASAEKSRAGVRTSNDDDGSAVCRIDVNRSDFRATCDIRKVIMS